MAESGDKTDGSICALRSPDITVLVISIPAAVSRKDIVGWLLHVPATCECISGTDLLRQFYVLPH